MPENRTAPLTEHLCLACGMSWVSATFRENRYCPRCGKTRVQSDRSPSPIYDGGGTRSAHPVEMPSAGALVLTFCKSDEVLPEAERYWRLETVTETFGSVQFPSRRMFRTVNGEHDFSDHGKTWKEAPPEYTLFLKSYELSFEEFAKTLARGGIEGVTGKQQGAITDWGEHNAARYYGVAQEALRLLVKPVADAEHRRRLAHEALRRDVVASAAGQVPRAEYEVLVNAMVVLRNQIAFAQQVLGGVHIELGGGHGHRA
jgi:hypothetical protein